ncbi:MAG TPA: substrate-binding domain-containing protein [Gemmatimonadaceae bacterium]|nr:substrate-binding domain-containing protein [Gemmatimonadaceae bacterium]
MLPFALAAATALVACTPAPARDAGADTTAVAPAPVVPEPGDPGPVRPASARPFAPELRVCADPNNLPFSNDRRQGFENRLAELVARDLGLRVEYVWWAQRRGFVRNTLRAGRCDVIMGVPTSFELALTTRPYYRSTYVFVTRADGPRVRSFDDPVLRRLRIGVQLVGDDGVNTPPAHALARRGIVGDRVVGYSLYGDYRTPNPPARIIDAVADGEVDVAVVWGPLAGYFAARSPVPLTLTPVSPEIDLPFLPFVYDVGLGVRHGETAFRDQLDAVLVRHRAEIDSLLDAYHIPRASAGYAVTTAVARR